MSSSRSLDQSPRPDAPRRWWLLAAELCLPLLLLGGVEMGFRRYVAQTSTLPLPRLFNSNITVAKYLAFRRGAARRKVDVVIMGLSPMMVVNSRHLSDFFRSHDRDVGVFNFAFPYHSIAFDRRLLSDIVLDLQTPKVIVYGVMPFNMLYEGSEQATNELIRQSPGFAMHEDTIVARTRTGVFTGVHLLLYREVIRDKLWGPEAKADPWVERARQIDEMGDAAALPPRPAPRRLGEWERRKYLPELRRFTSMLHQGFLDRHITALADFCREHGMSLVVVNSAVSPHFPELLPAGRRDYDDFVQRVARAAAASDVPFLDLSGPTLGAQDAFVDSHHLNSAGALLATEAIGDFLLRQGLLDSAAAAKSSPAAS